MDCDCCGETIEGGRIEIDVTDHGVDPVLDGSTVAIGDCCWWWVSEVALPGEEAERPISAD